MSPLPRGAARPDEEPDSHQEVAALLGAWALGACAPGESARVEAHLGTCRSCAAEALRFSDAVTLLEPPRGLDMDPGLRGRVLAGCLARRPAALPLPGWAAPLDAEAARLDALLDDMDEHEWDTPVELRWYEGGRRHGTVTTAAGVLDHLFAVDGLLARLAGLPDPLPWPGGEPPLDPAERTAARWAAPGPDARGPWREQIRALVRAAAGREDGGDGDRALPDAYVSRAFACWTHARDIAEAVDYPYGAPDGPHLRRFVDLAARRLPGRIARRRRAGDAASPARLAPAGTPGRALHLEVEGAGGGDWFVPVDMPDAAVAATWDDKPVARVALDDVVFCQLAAGRVAPDEVAAGGYGDADVIRDVLCAAAELSRL
ncbi:zf-HC2 domain-containing protein [Streptomyces sp. MS19]|uniref:zf-HC2 domain-containing protein n=1 Tax=Streptomyces sp. MS19 TaxID=3385972 RepID=UPI00399FF510